MATRMPDTLVLPGRVELVRERPWPLRAAIRGARFSRAKPLGAAGALIILLMVVAAIFAPVIAPRDYRQINAREKLQGPSAEHWFGTDQLGRDMYSRIVYGARAALLVGLTSTILGVGIGSLIGLVSGYFGGKLDMVMMRVIDAMQAFPGLILAMALVAVWGYGLEKAFLAIS